MIRSTPVGYFGGVTAFSSEDFQTINGFSNIFWGWGGEDDNLLQRLIFHNLTAIRPFDDQPALAHLARYRTLYHREEKPNSERGRLLIEGKSRFLTDGLTDLQYRKLYIQFNTLYTHIHVDIQQI